MNKEWSHKNVKGICACFFDIVCCCIEKYVIIRKLNLNFCEAQARVRQGSARIGKALKLKPLPRAYIKVSCHLRVTIGILRVTVGHPMVTMYRSP